MAAGRSRPQHPGCEVRGTPLSRTPVNKGKRRAGTTRSPGPSLVPTDVSCRACADVYESPFARRLRGVALLVDVGSKTPDRLEDADVLVEEDGPTRRGVLRRVYVPAADVDLEARGAPEPLHLGEGLYSPEVSTVRGLLQTDHLEHERGRGLALLLPGVPRRVQSFLQFHQDPKGRHPVGQHQGSRPRGRHARAAAGDYQKLPRLAGSSPTGPGSFWAPAFFVPAFLIYKDARVTHIRNGSVQSPWPRSPVILLSTALFLPFMHLIVEKGGSTKFTKGSFQASLIWVICI
jgi:hypothetical protein